MYSLCRGSRTLQENIEEYVNATKHSILGVFCPDEVAKFMTDNQAEVILQSKATQ